MQTLKRAGMKMFLPFSVIFLLFAGTGAVPTYSGMFREKAEVLAQLVLSDKSLMEELDTQKRFVTQEGSYTVFFSVSDGVSQAKVSNATGKTLRSAWDKAVRQAARQCSDSKCKALWVRTDIVTESSLLQAAALPELLAQPAGAFRGGLALGENYSLAFLEEQLNAGEPIGNEKQPLITPSMLPDNFISFSCIGYFCGEDGQALPLDQGVRIPQTDSSAVKGAVLGASRYLASMVKEDGDFSYGYCGLDGTPLPGYSILRHAGASWSLVCAYEVLGDQALAPPAKTAIDALIGRHLTYRDPDTAYVTEQFAGELKLGGNGIALAALTDYMRVFDTSCYLETAIQLGNGILSMQREDGGFVHVLHEKDFSLKDEVRTVYYDGEAAFGLVKLYEATGDKKWLKAARKALDYFIKHKYEEYGDHWISYAVNEFTRYCPENKYLSFGLKNGQANLETLYRRRAADPAGMEKLMCVYELYCRILTEGLPCSYLDEFDAELLFKAVPYRAKYLLGSYFYPESAMYTAKPSQVVNSFFVREDGFRVRIDDVQHSLGAYCLYLAQYDPLFPEVQPPVPAVSPSLQRSA